jgi:hypothetical protein
VRSKRISWSLNVTKKLIGAAAVALGFAAFVVPMIYFCCCDAWWCWFL